MRNGDLRPGETSIAFEPWNTGLECSHVGDFGVLLENGSMVVVQDVLLLILLYNTSERTN